MSMRPPPLLSAIGLFGLLLSAGTSAAVLVKGRFAYTFDGAEYPSGATACSALLKTMNPPERLKAAGAPEENGNVRCQGTQPDGSPGFDMYSNGVSYKLICPAGSREASTPDNSRQDPIQCECESDLVAIGGATCGPSQEASGKGPTASASASAAAIAAGNPNDRCLSGPAQSKAGAINPPDPKKCPLSYRAWQIRGELGKRKIPAFAGAIAVSEGVIHQRGKVVLVTAFNPKLWSVLKGFEGGRAGVLLPTELVGPSPEGIAQPHNTKNSAYEHAEDPALRWWLGKADDKSIDKAKGVRMGSDPKACEWCTDEYEMPRKDPEHFPVWITHERLGK